MEKELIKLIQKSLSYRMPIAAALIGDDAAAIKLPEAEYLFSMDNLVENIHFDPRVYTAYDIGWKAVAANISDIAAMGGQPLYLLVGLSLRRDLADKATWVQEFYQGLMDCSIQHGQAQVIGGDLTAAASNMISISIIGKSLKTLRRKSETNLEGYQVCVTGKFGNARSFLERSQEAIFAGLDLAAWLESEKQSPRSSDLDYALRPSPRLIEAQSLAANSLAIDSSDGLIVSLCELAEQNHIRIELNIDAVPRDPHISLEQALYGGEEYELVACTQDSPPETFKIIGSIVKGPTGVFSNGTQYRSENGFKHF